MCRAYVLFTALALPARPLAYHLHLALPANMALATHEDITQMCFERLHIPALILSERPLLSLFGVHSLHGLVVDVGRRSTEISMVHDSLLSAASNGRAYVGRDDCDNYLCHLLLAAQPDLPSRLSPASPLSPVQLHAALLSVVAILRDGNYLHFASAALSLNVAADGSRMEDEAEAAVDDAVLDDVAKALVSGQAAALLGKTSLGANKANVTTSGEHLTMPNPLNPASTITVGPERHRFAEPLFEPSFLAAVAGFGVSYSQVDLDRRAVSVPEAIAASVRTMDVRERPAIWDHVVVQGVGSAKGVPSAIMQALAGYVGTYAARPKLAKVPDYFPEFKDRLDLATFLGGSIVAKVRLALSTRHVIDDVQIGFLDTSGQHWVNKRAPAPASSLFTFFIFFSTHRGLLYAWTRSGLPHRERAMNVLFRRVVAKFLCCENARRDSRPDRSLARPNVSVPEMTQSSRPSSPTLLFLFSS